MEKIKKISLLEQLVLFGIPAIYFYILTHFFIVNFDFWGISISSIKWFITGFLIFIPIFFVAIFMCNHEGIKTKADFFNRLRLNPLSKRDLKYALSSTIVISGLTVIIMAFSKFLHHNFGIRELQSTPDFMKATVFYGWEQFYLLIWIVMFFFNIVGEEILWRGYILPRQEKSYGKFSWLANSIFWLIFHLCFGLDLIIILLPILFILPYAVYKTKNTYVGIIIHALINGPAFILISLGIIK